jgi:hypothetical protein
LWGTYPTTSPPFDPWCRHRERLDGCMLTMMCLGPKTRPSSLVTTQTLPGTSHEVCTARRPPSQMTTEATAINREETIVRHPPCCCRAVALLCQRPRHTQTPHHRPVLASANDGVREAPPPGLCLAAPSGGNEVGGGKGTER